MTNKKWMTETVLTIDVQFCHVWWIWQWCDGGKGLIWLSWWRWWWYINGDHDKDYDDDYKDNAFTIAVQFCQVCQLWFHPSSSCRGTNYKVFIFLKSPEQGFPEFSFFWTPENIDSLNFHFPCTLKKIRPGMSAVPEWLKSLRLHKYTGLVSCHGVFLDHVKSYLFLTVKRQKLMYFLDDELELRGDAGPYWGEAWKDGGDQGNDSSKKKTFIYCQPFEICFAFSQFQQITNKLLPIWYHRIKFIRS